MARYIPHDYQRVAADWAREKPFAGLFLDMGLRQDHCILNRYPRVAV